MAIEARTALSWFTWAVIGVLVFSVLAGQFLGQPVLLSYVETGSMAPTLEPGDAFIAIPAAVAGPVEPGDVIVYRATVLDGGGLTTHRVVAERDGGYVTQGDANVGTDQEAGEPLVKDGQIVAKAWQLGGDVMVIPKLGLIPAVVQSFFEGLRLWLARLLGRPSLLGSQGLSLALFLVGVIAYAAATWAEEHGDGQRYLRTRRRSHAVQIGWFIFALAVGVAVVATASMTLPLGAHEFEMISAENDAPGPRIVQTGTSENLTYTVPGGGVLPVVVVLEPASDGLEVSPHQLYVRGGEVKNATVTVTAADHIGYTPQYLHERRYLAVLPTGFILWLYAIHPWVPIVLIDLLLAGGFALLGFAWLGGGQLRIRSRTADTSLLERLRRQWR